MYGQDDTAGRSVGAPCRPALNGGFVDLTGALMTSAGAAACSSGSCSRAGSHPRLLTVTACRGLWPPGLPCSKWWPWLYPGSLFAGGASKRQRRFTMLLPPASAQSKDASVQDIVRRSRALHNELKPSRLTLLRVGGVIAVPPACEPLPQRASGRYSPFVGLKESGSYRVILSRRSTRRQSDDFAHLGLTYPLRARAVDRAGCPRAVSCAGPSPCGHNG
jgi:hypothetical protein